MQRHRPTILLYHDIEPKLFEEHLLALRRRYTIISLEALIDALLNSRVNELPDYSVVITFDDGYIRNYLLKPVLMKRPVPITMFICSGIVATSRGFWWNHSMTAAARERLKRLPDSERIAELERLGFSEMAEHEHRQALSATEIMDLKAHVDFQAHTVFHPCLPACTEGRVRSELFQCKADLENRFGLNIWALAYPNGDYSEREMKLAREVGYLCCLTTDAGYIVGGCNPFRLPRSRIDNNATVSDLHVQASGIWQFLVTLRQLRRRADKAGQQCERQNA